MHFVSPYSSTSSYACLTLLQINSYIKQIAIWINRTCYQYTHIPLIHLQKMKQETSWKNDKRHTDQ